MTAPTVGCMPRRRRPRSERDRTRKARLTERDLWILEAIAKMRFLTTSQVARLHFEGSRSAANKRLRKILDAGLIRCWVLDLAQDNVYSLDRKALGLLDAPEPGPNHTAPRGLDGNIDHLLAINEVRISIALGLPGVGGEIAWWRSEWELRSRFRERIIPDALFAIHWESGEQAFAMEIDNCTRSTRTFLRKVLAYRTRQTRGQPLYGLSEFVILVVGRDEQWLERYRLSVAHARLGSRIWFTSLSDLTTTGALGAIWRGTDEQEKYSLRTAANLPYGKEGSDAEDAIESRV